MKKNVRGPLSLSEALVRGQLLEFLEQERLRSNDPTCVEDAQNRWRDKAKAIRIAFCRAGTRPSSACAG